jgi:predicted dehydrogenase
MIIDNDASGFAAWRRSRRPERLRVGVAGAGWVTKYHLPAWAAHARRAEVVALADPDPARRSERAAAFGIPAAFASVEDMLSAADIDILDIAAPREVHARYVRLANAQGLAVLCQKPLAVNLAEAEALAGSIDPEVPLMVHDNWRFRATYRRIREWLDAGTAGDLRRVELHYLSSGMIRDVNGQRPALVRQPNFISIERLLVMEILIHQLDTLRYLLGDLELIDARLARSNDDIIGEDVATLTLRRCDDGLPVELVGNLAAHGEPPQARDQLRVFGADATISLDGFQLRCAGVRDLNEAFDPDRTYVGSYANAVGHFLNGLELGRPFETDAADNLRTLALVEAAYGFAVGGSMPYTGAARKRRSL